MVNPILHGIKSACSKYVRFVYHFSMHCKYLHLQYISTTTLEMYPSSGSGVRLQDVVHYISSTSISCSADVLRFKYILSVVLYTVKNILPFGEGKFTQVKYISSVVAQMYKFSNYISSVVVEMYLIQITSLSCVQLSDVNFTSGLRLRIVSRLAVV